MADTVTIPTRYQGPPGTANGGYVAGLLAATVGPTTTVRLVAAVRLETPLLIKADGVDGVALHLGDQTLAVARPADAPPPPPPAVPQGPAPSSTDRRRRCQVPA